MKNQNKITNIDAKKAFLQFVEIRTIPQIYIDEYWDYYIDEYNLQETWNTFLQTFIEEKFTYELFAKEYFRLIDEALKYIASKWNKETEQKYNELITSIEQKIPVIDLGNLPDGRYIDVDLHLAADMSFKYLDIFNDDTYTDSYDRDHYRLRQIVYGRHPYHQKEKVVHPADSLLQSL